MENELRTLRENVSAVKTVLNCQTELSIERDFVLPDYFPDIFRILKCTVEPSVTSQSINGSKLSFDAEGLVRILYLSENDDRINCIEQRLPMSKAFDIEDGCISPEVRIVLGCSYMNCRVVNRRRLDLRGAVSAAVRVKCLCKEQILTQASGGGIQLKKQLITYPAARLTASKRMTLIEDLELPSSKPALGTVLRCGCEITPGEERMIAGKLITKGEAEIELLYSCVDQNGADTAETMRFTVPISQMIDIEGIDESFEPRVEMTAAGCTVMPKGEGGTKLECEIILNLSCTAVKFLTGEAVTDAYSTKYECETEKCSLPIEGPAVKVSASCQSECTLSYAEGDIGVVYGCYAKCSALTLEREEGRTAAAGTLTFTAIGANSDRHPFLLENSVPFEAELDLPGDLDPEAEIDLTAQAGALSFYLTDTSSIDLKAEVKIRGNVSAPISGGVLSTVRLLTDKPKERDQSCALKLCRCSGKEDLWDVAKRYSTSVRAIEEENDLSDGLLLIPIES